MANVVDQWRTVAQRTLVLLFGGSNVGIDALTHLIKDGRFISGGQVTAETPPEPTTVILDDALTTANRSLADSVSRAFFAYAIPAIWTASGAFPFVVDSGMPCDFKVPFVFHVAAEMLSSQTCCNGTLYYLSGLSGDAQICHGEDGCEDNHFSALHGMEALHSGSFGGVTTVDIIQG